MKENENKPKEPYNSYMVGMKIIPSKTLEDDEIIPYPVECIMAGTMPEGFYVSLKLYEKLKHLEKKV